MHFVPYGPILLKRDDSGFLLLDRDSRSEIWEQADGIDPGLSDACGCYVFAVKAGSIAKPWYVGKAERQSFKRESLESHKIVLYNRVLNEVIRGVPLLYFYARVTPLRNSFSRPTKGTYSDISYLEKMLIGLALKRNRDLVNKQETTLLRTMIVPGLLNSRPGPRGMVASEIGDVMGY